jgi:hypothetical protein
MFFIFLFFSVGFVQVSEGPEVKENQIIFTGGKSLQYKRNKILYSDPLEAQKHSEPVSISEIPSLVKPWKKLVVTRTENFFEGSQKEVKVYDYEGNLLNPPARIEGDVFFLEDAQRIFLGGRSSHGFVDKSYLLDDAGKLVKEIPQPQNVFDFGFSDDGRIIWILSNHVRKGVPVGQVDIIDRNGNKVKTTEFTKAQVIEVSHNGKRYKISLQAPEMPG